MDGADWTGFVVLVAVGWMAYCYVLYVEAKFMRRGSAVKRYRRDLIHYSRAVWCPLDVQASLTVVIYRDVKDSGLTTSLARRRQTHRVSIYLGREDNPD